MTPTEIMEKYRPGSFDPPWNWEDERESLWRGECAHCGAIGNRQQLIIQKMQTEGWFGDPVLLGNDGRVWDGHHRLLAAVALGLEDIPVEYWKGKNADTTV